MRGHFSHGRSQRTKFAHGRLPRREVIIPQHRRRFRGRRPIRSKLSTSYLLSNAKQAASKRFRNSTTQFSVPVTSWRSGSVRCSGSTTGNANARILRTGDQMVSWVSFSDVAAFCVASLDNSAAQRATIEVGGPEPLSLREVVRIFEQESGRIFAREHVPVEALRAQVNAASHSLEKSMAALVLQAAQGDAMDMRPVLAKFQCN